MNVTAGNSRISDGFNPDPGKPKIVVPPNACDCHAHIIGPGAQYPFAAGRSYTPPEAPRVAYQRMLTALGLQRAVIDDAQLAAQREMERVIEDIDDDRRAEDDRALLRKSGTGAARTTRGARRHFNRHDIVRWSAYSRRRRPLPGPPRSPPGRGPRGV